MTPAQKTNTMGKHRRNQSLNTADTVAQKFVTQKLKNADRVRSNRDKYEGHLKAAQTTLGSIQKRIDTKPNPFRDSHKKR